MGAVPKSFDLPGCLKAAAAIETDLTQLAAALTEAQFHAPPRDGGWSVGYCIEHLVLTGQALIPKWDRALQEAVRQEGPDQEGFAYRWWQRRLLRYMADPSRVKHRTPPQLMPCCRRSVEETVGRFLTMHRKFVGRVAGSRGLDARRTKVQSPFASWIWYALGFSFDLTLAHERRHLRQAWRVRHQLMYEL